MTRTPASSQRPLRRAAPLALAAVALLAGGCGAAAGGALTGRPAAVPPAANRVHRAATPAPAALSPRPEAAALAARVAGTDRVLYEQAAGAAAGGRPLPPSAPGFVAGRVTVVGDSVTVDAAPALEAVIAHCQVDAVVGEQWETGVAELASLKASGQLGSEVVVALGTNGPVSAAEFEQLMSVVAGASRVVVVTNHVPDSWGAENNALFAAEARRYPRVRIANWAALGDAHPGWFYADDTHMPIGGPGAYGFAHLVESEL